MISTLLCVLALGSTGYGEVENANLIQRLRGLATTTRRLDNDFNAAQEETAAAPPKYGPPLGAADLAKYDPSNEETEHDIFVPSDGKFEGDMVLDTSQDAMTRGLPATTRSAITSTFRRWPKQNGQVIVPYTILDEFSERERAVIANGMKVLEDGSCVKFVPRTNEQAYIEVVKKGGCYSSVGRTGRKQDLSIGNGCAFTGTVQHEFLHALGFYHEQSRPDRDEFVDIKFENIQDGRENNFAICRGCTTQDHPYNKQSVMHYSRTAFSKNRQPTIVSKSDPNEPLGQRRGTDAQDFADLNALYECPAPSGNPAPTPTPPAPTPTPPRPTPTRPTRPQPTPTPPTRPTPTPPSPTGAEEWVYKGCYLDQGEGIRIRWPRLRNRSFSECAQLNERYRRAFGNTFGMEYPEGYVQPGDAECLLMGDRYQKMERRPDSDCEAEGLFEGRRLGGSYLLAVYAWEKPASRAAAAAPVNKYGFELRGKSGDEEVEITTSDLSIYAALNGGWIVHELRKPDEVFTIELLNASPERSAFIRMTHEFEVHHPNFLKWNCGEPNEQPECQQARDGKLLWKGEYSFRLRVQKAEM